MDYLIVIPSRRASTRLPDKLLLRDTGRPLLRHTIERAREAAGRAGAGDPQASVRVWVACDDAELGRVAASCGVDCVLVTEPCDSGTERIAKALPSLPECRAIVNLQADEPEMPASWIAECLAACAGGAGADVVTIAVPIPADDPAVDDPNVVKVVVDHDSYAMYFSRAAIPHIRRGGLVPVPRALRHVGIYAYTPAFLRLYHELPASDLEQSECLEQLRFLQAGAKIRVIVKQEPGFDFRGIDTFDDYQRFVARHQRTGR